MIAPSYLAALRERVERAGIVAVARAARMSRQTAWRAVTGGDGRRPNADAVERVRRGLAKVERAEAEMPPAIVSVRSVAHHAWIALADELTADELANVTADPRRALAAVRRGLRRR